ncbi:hypothetical protein M407DRAFT_23846 [Tulasnella calospora MUT 4182]|uniref:Uncharacterized protein n=1 Tax=Tulasnella calospora MUT 4182 TaxID=1051891 RepID=A0A0C3KZU7_9AGAM|nr:hypothetical protein M407DRAFT_23846 [Tulasnella calospora MUT 4182]
MSHIPGLHRQAFGTPLLSIFLISFTFLLQIAHTGSDGASTTALLSLLFIFPFAIVSYVAQTDSTLTSALPVLVCWFTIVFQRTLVLCSSVRDVSDSLVKAAISKTIDFTVELLTLMLSSTCSIKSGLELLEEGLLLQDESLGPQQSQEPSDPPSFPPATPEDLRTATSSTPSPWLATLPPTTNTSRLHFDATWTSIFDDNTNGSNAAPLGPATSLGLLSNDVVVAHANAHSTETTLGSTIISRASRSNQLDVALFAPINRRAKSNAGSVRKSSVPFPSLREVAGDVGSTGQTGPDVFAEIIALPKRSRKIAQKGLSFVNVDKFRGLVLAATAPTRADTIPPRIIIHEISKSSFSSSDSQNYAASATSSPHSTSASTFQTTATTPCSSQIDLQSDVEREDSGAPTATQLTTVEFEPPQTDERNLNEVAARRSEAEMLYVVEDGRADLGARIKFKFKTTKNVAQSSYHWRWAKTAGKLPEGGRRARRGSELVRQAPVSMPTPPSLVAWGLEDEDDDHLDEEEEEEEDDEDEKGFSKKAMRKTMAKSKHAAPGGVGRLFYGASTSTSGNGPLSQADWDTLEHYAAVPPSPKKVVQPQSPASTGVETEAAVPCWLSAPLPPLPEAASVKAKRLPRLRKLIKKIISFKPFKNRSRAP